MLLVRWRARVAFARAPAIAAAAVALVRAPAAAAAAVAFARATAAIAISAVALALLRSLHYRCGRHRTRHGRCYCCGCSRTIRAPAAAIAVVMREPVYFLSLSWSAFEFVFFESLGGLAKMSR